MKKIIFTFVTISLIILTKSAPTHFDFFGGHYPSFDNGFSMEPGFFHNPNPILHQEPDFISFRNPDHGLFQNRDSQFFQNPEHPLVPGAVTIPFKMQQ